MDGGHQLSRARTGDPVRDDPVRNDPVRNDPVRNDPVGSDPVAEGILAVSRALFAKTGEVFFRTLVTELTRALEVDHAIVAEFVEGATGERTVRTLAVAGREGSRDNFVCAITGTPFEPTSTSELFGELFYVERDIRQHFPHDECLVKLGVESYLGAPLNSATGQVLGLVAILHSQPLPNPQFAETLSRIFIHQASAELERWRAGASALHLLREQLFDRLPIDLAIFDLEGRFQYVNPSSVRDPEMRAWLIGKTEIDYCSKRQLDPALAQRRAHYRQQALVSGQPLRFAETFPGRDGVERRFVRSFFPVTHREGEVTQLIGWGIDMTEQLRAEEALRQRERYFSSLIQHSLDLITVLDGEGNVQFESPSAEWVIGFTPQERLHTRAADAVHPEDQQTFLSLLLPPADPTGPVPSIEYRHRHKNGGWRILESRATYQLDDPVVCGIVVHSRDMTERKGAEDAVRKSEERYRRLFEQSKDVVYMSSPEGQLLDINQAGVELLGYDSKESLLKVDLGRDVYVDPWQRHKLLDKLAEQGFVRDYEAQLKVRTGKILNVLVTSSAVRDARGEVVAFLGILRDVTTQRQLEEQLRQSQKMEAVGRLAGGLAHDFNNLLTAINGYGELLQYQLPQDDPRRTFIDEICNAGRRATELTAKLLTLSRRKAVSPRVIDLNRMVQQLQNLLHRLIGEDIDLVTDLDLRLGRVRVDPGQMEQVLLNLAINARDAMPNGGRLTIATRNLDLDAAVYGQQPEVALGSYVSLTVTDNGVGMEPEVQEHIFEPFFTTKSKGKGTGLGLSTAYATVQQSGGYIAVNSKLGEGTTFEVVLPRIEDPPTSDEPLAVETLRQGDETILLVEDDPAVRRLVHRILSRQGYTVLEAATPNAALAQGGNVDLLVSDVVMPAMSGPDLATRLRERHPQLKVLFISGYTDDKFKDQPGLQNTEYIVLQKPFNAHVLSEKVRDVLDASKRRQKT